MINGVCPSCGRTAFDQFRMNLLECNTCGLVVDRAVWQQSVNETLEDEWFGEGYEPQRSPWVRVFERWNNARTYRRLASLELPGKSLLEIGVGSGSFLQYMRDLGFDVLGCDLSKAVCRMVGEKYGLATHHGSVSELPDTPQFDIVVMNHVLEHVADPVGVLREIRLRLKPGGALHIAVPNIASWDARLPGWTSFEPYHLLYFTPKTLHATVEQAGFIIEKTATHESFSGWFLAVLRTLLGTHRSKASDRTTSREARERSPVEHAYRVAMVVSGILTLPLRVVQGLFGKGDEVVLIARCEDGH